MWIQKADILAIDNCALIAYRQRDDDYTLRRPVIVRYHELWARADRLVPNLREVESGLQRYTPTTCFETFPFPQPTGEQREAIADAARKLNELREGWLNPEGAAESELKKRTLTNLYNARPTWLQLAHEQLDKAVFDAYGWPDDLADPEILERLLALNLERAA